MSGPTNLRRARKRKQREAQARDATASRTREGESKAERALREKEAADRARLLDGAKRTTPDS